MGGGAEVTLAVQKKLSDIVQTRKHRLRHGGVTYFSMNRAEILIHKKQYNRIF